MRADTHFHRVLADSTHNPLLIAYIGAGLVAVRAFNSKRRGHSDQIAANLESVYEAVKAQSDRRAGEAMWVHLRILCVLK